MSFLILNAALKAYNEVHTHCREKSEAEGTASKTYLVSHLAHLRMLQKHQVHHLTTCLLSMLLVNINFEEIIGQGTTDILYSTKRQKPESR